MKMIIFQRLMIKIMIFIYFCALDIYTFETTDVITDYVSTIW